VEARLAEVPSRPDGWHASLVTVDVDWTRFTEADLVEATERLTRLSTALRLLAAGTGWTGHAETHGRCARSPTTSGMLGTPSRWAT